MATYVINKYHGKYNIAKRTSAVKYIVVHYVGSGTSAVGSAKNNCIYFSGGNRNASAHYFIDDGSIYEYADPKTYATWHCGDGSGKYGITNQNSIGIEVCINGNKPFTEEEIKRLTWLVQKLMKDFSVPASCVVRHYDASRKQCPLYYVKNSAKWTELHKRITAAASEEEEKPKANLNVNGVWDKQTTLALQKALNAPYKDGEISRQNVANKKYLAACTTGWQFGSGNQSGSQTIKLLQTKIGVKADGVMGKDSVKALQTYLGTYVDGYLDKPSKAVQEMQRRLNAGTF